MILGRKKESVARKRLAIGLTGLALVYAGRFLARTARRQRYALPGKRVVITGGSRGLGLAIAKHCLPRGADVCLMARDAEELERARATLSTSEQDAGSIMVVSCDVSNPDETNAAMQQVRDAFGQIDVLINNAGVIHVGPAENQDLASFQESMNVNFYGSLNTIYAVMPEMLDRRSGHIVNVASIGGLVAVPHLLPYSASKFALVGLSRGLSAELAAKGIKVLTVCPWLVRTGSHTKAHFTGNAQDEYQWFSAGATLPIISVSADAAAQAIVDAIEDGRSELLISGWSHMAGLTAQLAPAFTTMALSLVNRFLPASDTRNTAAIQGSVLEETSPKIIRERGRIAAARWNQ